MNPFVHEILIITAVFNLYHAFAAACGGLLTDASGTITSPGYPGDYGNNLSCDWDITCPVDKKIIVTFIDVDLEYYGSKCFDKIQIFEGSSNSTSELYELCETDESFSFRSTSQFVRIRLTSDSTVNRRGFVANYTFVDSNCHYAISGTSGVITSPNYGGKYPSNLQCSYSFSFGADQRLSLKFLSFDLEEESKSGSCSDFLRLRNADFKVYGEYCGDSLPRNFSFYRGAAVMLFVSDKSKNKDGFRLAYQVENVTECLQDPQGISYAGYVNITANGSECARWDSTLAMKNGFNSLLDQENYCRNPNNRALPWCFSVDSQSPQDCNISLCDASHTTEYTTTSSTLIPTTTTSSTSTTAPTTTTRASVTTSLLTSTSTGTTSTTTSRSDASTTTPRTDPLTAKTSTMNGNASTGQNSQISADLLILFIVTPILLLIIIFVIAICIVRLIVKKKKMSLPVSQLRSIVNPNYVSKNNITEGYMVSYENDLISRQSIVAARESVVRMSRKNSRSQAVESVYYSLEDINNASMKDKTKAAKNEESPYVEANDSYDVLRQKRNKKIDPSEYRTYNDGFILEEGEEIYDHTNTSSRVLHEESVDVEDQRIDDKSDTQGERSDNASVVQQSNVTDVTLRKKSSKSDEAPVYASVRKSRKSFLKDRKSKLPKPIDMANLILSIDEKNLSEEMDDTWKKLQDGLDPTPSAVDEEEAVYEESDVTYDQLRRPRTRRNKNLGDKVSIYSEINPDTPNYEEIYNTTESAGRIKEVEPTVPTGTSQSESESLPQTKEEDQKPDVDEDQECEETDKSDSYIDSSKL